VDDQFGTHRVFGINGDAAHRWVSAPWPTAPVIWIGGVGRQLSGQIADTF
jgi:hypothetical protein